MVRLKPSLTAVALSGQRTTARLRAVPHAARLTPQAATARPLRS